MPLDKHYSIRYHIDMERNRPELDASKVIAELPLACADESEAVKFFEAKRWGDCPCCVHCGSVNVYQMTGRTGGRNKDYLWRCRDCKERYSVRTGTIYAESRIPLCKWARAYWESATCKNGISALELKRKLQISYKASLFMLNRIRFAMMEETNPPKLSGTIECDETYVGGKPRNKGWKHGRTSERGQPRPKWTSKVPVIAMVERGGIVRAKVVANVTAENVSQVLRENIDIDSSTLMSDESRMYLKVGKPFKGGHFSTNHGRGEYVDKRNPEIHSNTVEGFFSRVKRSLNGTFHAVSKQHLPKYINQAAFLYNSRTMNDGERVTSLIARSNGKRFTFVDYRNSAAG